MPVNQVKRNGSYVPLSVSYYKDAALIEAGERAELLFLRVLAFCGETLSDGCITDGQLTRHAGAGLTGVKARAERLVEVGLWERNGSGYVVRQWTKWNRTRAEIQEKQRADSERKRKGTP